MQEKQNFIEIGKKHILSERRKFSQENDIYYWVLFNNETLMLKAPLIVHLLLHFVFIAIINESCKSHIGMLNDPLHEVHRLQIKTI